MSANIQELIDRIKTDGVEAARKKAQDIEQTAEAHAKEIIKNARREADLLVTNAKAETRKMEDASRTALRQAARDTLITLRKDIQSILQTATSQDIKETLTPERLTHIIEKVVIETLKKDGNTPAINVVLNEEDLAALKDGLLQRLHGSLKSSVNLKSSDGLRGGFMISYDQNQASFDFSNQALAEYLSQYVNEHLAKLLKEAA